MNLFATWRYYRALLKTDVTSALYRRSAWKLAREQVAKGNRV